MIWNTFAFFDFVSIITPPVLKIIKFPLQHLIATWKEKRLLQGDFSTYVPGWCYNLLKQMSVCLCKGVSDLHVTYLRLLYGLWQLELSTYMVHFHGSHHMDRDSCLFD